MKKKLMGKKILNCSFHLYRFRKYVSYGFPTIIFCNPGAHFEIPCTIKRRKANWIGHILRRNCLLKHVNEGKMEVRREVMGRRGK